MHCFVSGHMNRTAFKFVNTGQHLDPELIYLPVLPISAWISPLKGKSPHGKGTNASEILEISRISNTTFCSIIFPPAFYTGFTPHR